MQAYTEISTELQSFIEAVHHNRKIEKGMFLYQEGTKANELFLILSGKIQLSKMIPDGRELTLRMASEGDLIGELSLFCSAQNHMQNAKVMESGEVAVIFKSELEKKLSENHEIALEFMKWLSQEHRKTQTKFRDLILHGKKGALYSTLIRLSNSYGLDTKDGIVINTSLTNQELANFCGTSREVVNRLLSELRKSNIISIDKGIITIHDLEYIKIEIDCENCPIEICSIE
ncbi:Crp/Fnr family transcriptional regulator [Robertmurraya yapensis]|uniref:Crp/Fnr family transcriptional regulator n=1 Tax=Bacillus yapensis TaxID=2492960 RepID=A0A431W7N1_9BACI|nr:Crp/Fnr family transcriptional regulator [Bacillus yapensis]RTR31515.1 Crp/Fnr family transcriptional regulator [Bacillus yapensis]TKS95739.1 cyclic nucleotide-binding domain-containing protein [Bacillus yapensis]